MPDETIRKALEEYCQENSEAILTTAAELKEQNILRVFFGIDHINDDGDLSEYANIEYSDGRTETLTDWPPALDEDVFGWLPYAGAYVFDVQQAKIFEDSVGGMHWPYESHAFAYHTPERLAEIKIMEEEADEFIDGIEETEEFKEFMKDLGQEDKDSEKD